MGKILVIYGKFLVWSRVEWGGGCVVSGGFGIFGFFFNDEIIFESIWFVLRIDDVK